MSYVLKIDANKCTGHGRCYVQAPDLLSDDEQGYVAERGTVVPVPEDLLEQAEAAEQACPEMAISLETDDS